MKWTEEADQAIRSIPFFVRILQFRVVEEKAQYSGSRIVTIEHVRDCQKRFLMNMDSEVKGSEVETCFVSGASAPIGQ